MTNRKSLWWVKYRNRQRRLNNMNTEMVFRNVLKKTFREYVDNSSIGGVRQMWERNRGIKQRLLWMVIFYVMFSGVIYFLLYIWSGSLNKPLIISMESSTYPISEIDFPAVSICNINRISKRALKEFARAIYPVVAKKNESIIEVEQFCLQFGRLIDFTYNKTLLNHPFNRHLLRYLGDTHGIVDIMKYLAPSCDDMLLKCSWAGSVVNCSSIFSVRRTVRGHCCVFNYILDYESASRPNNTLDESKRQTEAGLNHGLCVILDPMLEDYAYPVYNSKGFEVLIFDPSHFPDPSGGRVSQRTTQSGQTVMYELRSVKQIATQEVRQYTPQTRKCLFHDEQEAKFNNMYSYSACIINCRIKTVQSLCKCTPYYLPVPKSDGSVCTLDDLKCLNKYKEKLFYIYPTDATNTEGLGIELQYSLNCPDCLPDCEHTQHYTKYSKISITNFDYPKKDFRRDAFENINITDKSFLNIYQSTRDGGLNRLDVVSYWFEIISNIGGFSGILVGYSIVSLFEIIYFFVIRLFIQLYKIYADN